MKWFVQRRVIQWINRALAYTLVGMDVEAQRDIDQAVELGVDRVRLEGMVEQAKKAR